MIRRVNLAHGTTEDIHEFCRAVIELAAAHETGHIRPWTGHDLCREYAAHYRGFHERMASSLYNKTRDTIRAFKRKD